MDELVRERLAALKDPREVIADRKRFTQGRRWASEHSCRTIPLGSARLAPKTGSLNPQRKSRDEERRRSAASACQL